MSFYAKVLALSIAFPMIMAWWPPLKIGKRPLALLVVFFIVFSIFVAWDILAVNLGHWYFGADAVWSFRLFGLPLEEYLFFIAIPFCSLFTWQTFLFITGRKKQL